MKVSVIVPIYNASRTVKRCVESILNQTYADFELLLIDDGSNDGSLEICQMYTDARIKLYTHANRGVSYSRNFGLAQARGEYITFCDADDYYTEDRLEKTVRAAVDTGADIVICGHYTVYPKGISEECKKRSGFVNQAYIFESMIKNHQIGGFCWNKLFRTETVKNLAFPTSLTHHEDTYFFVGALKNARSIYSYAECLYYYCNTADYSATKDLNRIIKDHQSVYTAGLQKIIRDYDLQGKEQACFRMLIFITSLGLKRRYKREKGKNQEVINSLNDDIKKNMGCYFASAEIGVLAKMRSLIKMIV